MKIAAVTDTLLSPAVSAFMMLACPEAFDTSQYSILLHIQTLKATFERSINPDSNEVIKVTSTYKITTETPFASGTTQFYCDFTPRYACEGYSSTQDLIESCSDKTIFRGQTYAISNADDFALAKRRGEQQLKDINTGGDEELLLDNQTVAAKDIAKGQYQWYHFTAPENGVYNFYSIGSMDTYVEVFDHIVPGRDVSGRIAYNDDVSSLNRNYSLDYKLFAGKTIYLRVHGFNWTSTGTYHPMVTKVGELFETIQEISKTDFGYSKEYNRTVESKRIETENGFSFIASRFRCGYINDQYLTLSAKRKDFDTAYLVLDFEQAIYKFDFSIGLWSNEENISSRNTYVLFQYATYDGKWVDAIDFNMDEMSKDKDSLVDYSYEFNCRVTKIRFYVHTNQVNYEKNKGRIVLDNIKVSY